MTDDVLDSVPSRLLQRVTCPVLITDARLEGPGPRIVYANAAWQRLSGYELASTRSQTLAALDTGQKPDGSLFSVEHLRKFVEEPEHNQGQTTDHRESAAATSSGWSVEPILDRRGSVVGFGFVQGSTGWPHDSVSGHALDIIRELQGLLDHNEPSLDTARQQVARAAMQLCGADAAVVEQGEGDEMVYRAVAGIAEGLERLHLPIDGSASGYCYASGESLLIGDTLSDDRVPLGRQAVDIGFRSGILVPLVHGDQCYGVLKVFSGTPNAFGNTELEFLDILAGLLTAVLYRARIYEIESERRRHLVDSLPMLVAYVDAERRYREVNAAYADWFGQSVGEIVGKPVWEVVGDSAYEQVRPYMDRVLDTGESITYEETVAFPHAGATVISVDYSPDFRADGTVAGFYALVRDITKAKGADQDHLTELANRRRFEEEALRQLESSGRQGRPLSLIIADVDHFKRWNDTWGHQIGDRILKTIASHLRDQARPADLVARWGGEEFAILTPETQLQGAATLAERIRSSIAAIAQPEGNCVTLSFGVAEARGDERSLRKLTHAADQALYAAKKNGRNRVERSP